MLVILAACSPNENYQKQDIDIRRNEKSQAMPDTYVINGYYEVSDKTGLFESPDDDKPFDYIDKGSLVKILAEEENGYIRIDYFSNIAYIRTSNLACQ